MEKETLDLVKLGVEIVALIILPVLGFILNGLRSKIIDLEKAHAEKIEDIEVDQAGLGERVTTLQTNLAEKYVMKEDLHRSMDEVKKAIDDLRDLILQLLKVKG